MSWFDCLLVSICLSIHLSLFIVSVSICSSLSYSICLSFFLSVCLSIIIISVNKCPFVSILLSFRPSACLFIHLCFYQLPLSVRISPQSICQCFSVYLPICPSSVSICLYIPFAVHLSVYHLSIIDLFHCLSVTVCVSIHSSISVYLSIGQFLSICRSVHSSIINMFC